MEPVQLVETIYRDLDAPGWLAALREEATLQLRGAMWVTATEVRWSAGRLVTSAIAADDQQRELHEQWHGSAPASLIDAIYRRGPVSRVARLVAGTPFADGLAAQGASDIVGAVGMNPDGSATVVAYATPDRSVRGVQSRLLARLAAHLAAATRLRGAAQALEAVCAPDGRVAHAEGDARDATAREALRAAARRIDRARSRRGSLGPEERVGLWNALTLGRWSLVERFDSDGRRFLVALRNDPIREQEHRLHHDERAVAELAAIGRPIKVIAYELGRSEAWVSTTLRRALEKLGIASRADLIELRAALGHEAAR